MVAGIGVGMVLFAIGALLMVLLVTVFLLIFISVAAFLMTVGEYEIQPQNISPDIATTEFFLDFLQNVTIIMAEMRIIIASIFVAIALLLLVRMAGKYIIAENSLP